MMKTKKRVISILCTFIMVSCLDACGNSTPAIGNDVVSIEEGTGIESSEAESTEASTEIVESSSMEAIESTETEDGEMAEASGEPAVTASPEPTATSSPTVTPEPSPEPTPEPHVHQYTEVVTRQATCAEAGEKTLTCSCGSTKTETIPATGEHNWVEQTQIVHHDEVGSIETVEVGTDKRTVYYCSYCRFTLGLGDDAFSADNQTDVRNHCYEEGMAVLDAGGTLDEARAHAMCNGFCIDYYDPVYEEQYIVKYPAYDETIVTGYICSVCGAVQ